jgi:hypothetical protein
MVKEMQISTFNDYPLEKCSDTCREENKYYPRDG